jgi:hypothetical protein
MVIIYMSVCIAESVVHPSDSRPALRHVYESKSVRPQVECDSRLIQLRNNAKLEDHSR